MKCRLCLKRKNGMIDASSNGNICREIEICLGINLDDCIELPRTICCDCHKILEEFSLYRKFCLTVDRILKNALRTGSLHIFLNENDSFIDKSDIVPLKSNATRNSPTIVDVKDEKKDEMKVTNPREIRSDSLYEIFETQLNSSDEDTIVGAEEIIISQYEEHCQGNIKNYNVIEYEEIECNPGHLISECTNSDNEKKPLDDHMKNCEKIQKCDFEGSFISEAKLQKHEKKHTYNSSTTKVEDTSVDLNISKSCSKRYDEKSLVEKKVLVCSVCGKMFVRDSLLKSHLKSHYNLLPNKCLYTNCNYQTNSLSALGNHIKIHKSKQYHSHFNSDKVYSYRLKFKCLECNCSFLKQHVLDKHMLSH